MTAVEGLALGTVAGIHSDTSTAGESRVRRFVRQSLRRQGQCRAQEADLTGDPWAGCEDLAVEDQVEWYMDFFRRRDAARPERPEDLVTRALAANKPSSRFKTRLEAIVREPVHYLDPVMLERQCRKSGSSAASDGSSPRTPLRSVQLPRNRSRLSGNADDTPSSFCAAAVHTPGAGSALSLASVESSASGSGAGLWLESSPLPSSPGLSEIDTTSSSPSRRVLPGGAVDWELEFTAQSAVEEVWRRLKQGRQTQDIFKLLTDTRRHLISCQVQRHQNNCEEHRRTCFASMAGSTPIAEV